MENNSGDPERWKQVSVDGLISCLVSFKVITILPLVFVYLKSQYVCKLLQESKGYRMGQPEKGDVKRTPHLASGWFERVLGES